MRPQDIFQDNTKSLKNCSVGPRSANRNLNFIKKRMCQVRLDYQGQQHTHKQHLFQLDRETNPPTDSRILTGTLYTPDKPHRATGQSLLYRDSLISPFPPTQRTPWTSHGPTTIQNRMDRQVFVPALLSESAAGQELCGWITGEPPAYLHSGYINRLGKDVPLMNWSIVQWTDPVLKVTSFKGKANTSSAQGEQVKYQLSVVVS